MTEPDRAKAMELLEQGLAARKRGDRAAALELFLSASQHLPNNSRIVGEAAAEHLELGQLDDAEKLYHRARSLAEDSRPSLRGLARIARKRGDRERALVLLQEIAGLDPHSPAAQFEVATELRERGRTDEAIAACEAIVARHPAFAKAYRALGQMARDRGRHRQALGYFKTYATAESSDINGKIDLIRELREVGVVAEAVALAAELQKLPEPPARALVEIAACLRLKGERAEAIAVLERAAGLEPGHIGIRLALAADYRATWELDKAAALYDAALEADETNVPALIGRGVVERQRGNAGEALIYLKAAADTGAAKTGADRRTAISAVSAELRATAQYAEARELLCRLMHDAPADTSYPFELAKVEHAAGNLAQSSRYLAQVIEQEPDRIEAYVERAAVEFKLGNPTRASGILREALAQKPEHPDVLAALGDNAWAAETFERALAFYHRAAQAAPANETFRWRIARCLLMQGRTAECFESIEAMAKGRPSPNYFHAKIAALLQLGDRTAAQALLKEATARYPFHAQLWLLNTTFDIDLGRYDLVAAALARPPGYADAGMIEMLHGLLMSAQYRFEEAQAHFERAFQYDMRKPAPLFAAARSALLNLDLAATQSHLQCLNQVKAAELELTGASTKISQSNIGQIMNEFRCEPEGLGRLTSAKGLPPVSRLLRLIAAARDYPDYTAAAMLLLIELRCQDLLRPKPKAEAPSPAMPRRIVQFWDSPDVPPEVERLSWSWREQNPGMEYVRFSEASARDYLGRVAPEALGAFNRAREAAMKADLFRLAYLTHDGGFYVDADDRCIAPLPVSDWANYDVVLYQEDWGTIGNNFIGAVPHQPLFADALTRAVAAVNRGDTEMLWLSTGPGLLTRVLAHHVTQASDDLENALRGIAILKRSELLGIVSIHCRISYKMSEKHWGRTTFRRSRRSARRTRIVPLHQPAEVTG